MKIQCLCFLLKASICVAAATESIGDLLSTSGLDTANIGDISEQVSGASPWNQDYPDEPTPWKITVDPKFIAYTKLKVALTRYHHDIDQADWIDGPPRQNVSQIRDYWLNEFDWFEVEKELNADYKHFRTTVTTGLDSNYTEAVPLHFVHHVSPHANAIPLLFMHGTPGSFLEVGPIIHKLTHPPAGQPAFHVVAPDLPGYAFSPAPKVAGMGPAHMGDALNELMHQLNYTKYVLQAGDYGGIILRYMAGQHTESVVSVLSNFWMVTPNATDLDRYAKGETSAAENSTIQVLQNYEDHGSGYRLEMGTTPLQVVIATTDSPMGNLMFNYQIMWFDAAGYTWPLKTIVLWAMMYWLPGPYAAERHYREMANAGIFSGFTLGNNYPYVKVPVAITEYPGDLWFGTPLDWAQRYGNVVKRTVHNTGGHFPSTQTPDLLVGDIREFFGNTTLANTGIFLHS